MTIDALLKVFRYISYINSRERVSHLTPLQFSIKTGRMERRMEKWKPSNESLGEALGVKGKRVINWDYFLYSCIWMVEKLFQKLLLFHFFNQLDYITNSFFFPDNFSTFIYSTFLLQKFIWRPASKSYCIVQ